MHTQGQPYPMRFLKAEHQICCIKDLDTIIISDHHYLLSKDSDTKIAFLFWQATESRNFLEQALQGIVK